MSYIKFDPFRGMEQVANRMSQVFSDLEKGVSVEYGSFSPRIDIAEDEKNLFLYVELPGIKKEDVKITINDDRLLYIKGEKKRDFDLAKDGEVNKESRTYIRAERAYGEFNRSFALPENINSDNVNANFNNGVLTVTLTKIEPVKPKEIEIQIG